MLKRYFQEPPRRSPHVESKRGSDSPSRCSRSFYWSFFQERDLHGHQHQRLGTGLAAPSDSEREREFGSRHDRFLDWLGSADDRAALGASDDHGYGHARREHPHPIARP